MKAKSDPCRGCIYYIKVGLWWVCDYITIAGHRRPCPIGAGCVVKETEGGMKKWDRSKAYELYQAGAGDAEIAREVGVSSGTIYKWRREKGLPAHKPENQSAQADPSPGPTPDPPAAAETERSAPQSVEPQEPALDSETIAPGGPVELHLELGGGWARIRAPTLVQAGRLWTVMQTCISALEAGGAADG